jgi:hypothetical protein
VDKLSITVRNPNSVYKNSIKFGGTIDHAKEFLKAAYTAINDTSVFPQAKHSPYKINVHMAISSSAHRVLLQMDPKQPEKYPFARFEFNPVKLGDGGLAEFAANCISFFDTGYEYVWDHGRVSRMDVAIDLHDVTVGQMRFLSKGWTTQKTVDTGGQFQTIYIGKSTGQQTKVYNKLLQLNLSNSVPVTRIERSLKASHPLATLHTLKNPFGHLTLAHAVPKAPQTLEPHMWELISDSITMRGPAGAMSLLPKDLRRIVVKHLDATSPDYWTPVEFWKHWPDALAPLYAAFAPPFKMAAE